MLGIYGGGWFTGVAPGLQNRCGVALRVPGGFDSRTLPPFRIVMNEKLRNIPALHQLLSEPLVTEYGHDHVVYQARLLLSRVRTAVKNGQAVPDEEALAHTLESQLSAGIDPVLNGTGVVLHTNLGRAPWDKRAQKAAQEAMDYAAVEIDVRDGKRGRRGGAVEDRICALFGAEAALVVNNCAAAVLLGLRTFARGKKVLVSRGELVEIGGGYRVPEVLEESGAEMVEVGTTNRTHLKDYQSVLDALPPASGVVLKVHQSNFRQEGFVTRPAVHDLASLPAMLMVDMGSGNVDTQDDEPSVAELLKAGAPVVCFSGDKLLGGPQAGVMVGKREHIEKARRCPLYRALRPDKVTLAGIGATLDVWLRGEKPPLWEMIDCDLEALKEEVERWTSALSDKVQVSAQKVQGAVGGGSMPGKTWTSWALCIEGRPPEHIKARLLQQRPPVYGLIKDNAFYIDARTIVPLGNSQLLLDVLSEAFTAEN